MKIWYPKNLEEIEENADYQVKIIGYSWTQSKTYTKNMCRNRKNYLKKLITEERLRILTN